MKWLKAGIAIVTITALIVSIFYSTTRVVPYVAYNEAGRLAAEKLTSESEFIEANRLNRFEYYYDYIAGRWLKKMTAEDYYYEIDYHIAHSDYERALEAVDMCLADRDEFTSKIQRDLIEKKGYLHTLLGEFDAAIAAFDELGEHKSKDVVLMEVQIYLEDNKGGEALNTLTEYVINKPNDIDVRQIYAELLYYERHFEDSKLQYDILIDEKDEQKGIYYAMRGLCRQQLSEMEESISDFQTAIDVEYEDEAFCYFQMSIAYYMIGNDEKAIEYGEMALDIGSEQVDIGQQYKYIGQSYLRLGDMDSCIEAFDKAEEASDAIDELYYFRGTAYMINGDYESAIADFDIAVTKEYQPDLSYYNRALCRMQIGDDEGAADDLEQVIELTDVEDIIASAESILNTLR